MAKVNYSDSEYLRKQREYRAATGNAASIKYERTKAGKLMRTYRNMLSRVSGVLKKKRHLYEGKPILSREDFCAWAMASEEFHRLYDGWVASGYRCGASPSVDRINPDGGYEVGNMEWVTHSENSRRSSIKRQPSLFEPRPLRDAA